jgi:tRNA nucleotidyltransferase (CCA-adding enzyme)
MKISTHVPSASARDLARRADLTIRRSLRLRRRFESRIAEPEREALERLGHAAARTGTAVYLVGGVVRDLLLDRPVRDLDVIVAGDVAALARRLGGRVRTHRAFGTATVRMSRGVLVDLARTRRERYPRPAVLPEVSPGDLAQDLARRDFTINSMAAPLLADGPRGLIDPFAGLEDLRRGLVRALHERSFIDDPTRAFRAARLGGELGFEIETHTAGRIRSALRTRVFDRLSAARLRHEVERTLESSRAGRAVRLLARHGLLATLDAELRAPRGIASSLDRLAGALVRFRKRFPDEPLLAWSSALSLVLRCAGAEVLDRALARLQPSRGVGIAVRDGVDALRRLPRALARSRPLKRSVIYAACHGRSTEALLSVLGGTRSTTVRRAVRDYLYELREVRLDISGRDLLRSGIRPGPAVARALREALSAKLDGRAASRDAQLRAALAAAGRS